MPAKTPPKPKAKPKAPPSFKGTFSLEMDDVIYSPIDALREKAKTGFAILQDNFLEELTRIKQAPEQFRGKNHTVRV